MLKEAYVFSQFLHLLPRYEFQHIVTQYNGDYRTRRFSLSECIFFVRPLCL
ncbi:MAG: DUF4372 domain-containing protein [Gammaproteobacteria bacterium]|nr:DUF4372 domain-containing protein [Gammaproteobacteria bacterium]